MEPTSQPAPEASSRAEPVTTTVGSRGGYWVTRGGQNQKLLEEEKGKATGPKNMAVGKASWRAKRRGRREASAPIRKGEEMVMLSHMPVTRLTTSIPF